MGVPFRYDYSKIGLHFGLVLATILLVVGGIVVYQWRVRENSYQLALRLMKEGESAEALTLFRQLSQNGFKDTGTRVKEASLALASLRLEQGKDAEAIELLGPLAAEGWPKSHELLTRAVYEHGITKGKRALESGDYAAALGHFELAKSVSPTSEVEELLETARREQGRAAHEKYQQGLRLMAQRNYSQAVTAFNAALKISPAYTAAADKRDEAQRYLNQEVARKREQASMRQQESAGFIEIVRWSWSVSDFSVGTIKVTVKNTSPYGIKDLQFEVDYYAPSGTSLGSGRETAYETVQAGQTRTFTLNEFADRRAKKASIRVVDARWEWQPSEQNLDW